MKNISWGDLAIWSYDLFPGFLYGAVVGVNSETGLVKISGYGESTFKPIGVIKGDENIRQFKQKMEHFLSAKKERDRQLKESDDTKIFAILTQFTEKQP